MTKSKKVKKLEKKEHEDRIHAVEAEMDRFVEEVVEHKHCPTCHEPCAQDWCGRCERVLSDS